MSISKGLAARLDASLEEVVAELLELGPGKGLHKMLRNSVNRHDVRQVDLGGSHVGEFDLRLLRSLFESLECHRVVLEMYAGILGSELLVEPVDDLLVEVVTSEVGVTVGGLDLEHAVSEFHYGDIEGTAAKVIDCDLHIFVLLVKAICQRSRCRLVDDTLHVKTGDLSGLLGSLTL